MKLEVIKEGLTKVWKSSTAKALLVIGGMLLVKTAFATDVLENTTTDLSDTYNGSIKKWIYLIEGLFALGALFITRKIASLFVVGAIAIFLNIIAKLAGFI